MAKKSKTTKAEGPMDPDARETRTPEPPSRRTRTADGVLTLIDEVSDLFPETSYELGSPNQWGVISSVTFEVAGLEGLPELLSLVETDARVKEITEDDKEGLVEISLHPSFRTMDIREQYGLAEAWMVLCEEEDGA